MTRTNESVITVRGLHHRFGRNEVLRGIDLEVPRGSVTALLGRNGEGKTTLLRLLTGWLPPQRGRVQVLGLDPARRGPEVRRRVGYVPDHLEVSPWMRVVDYCRFVAAFHPTWNRETERRLYEQLQLDPTARVKNLSKGQRTKHALVAALAHDPELLLLDEPFSGLDPIVRHEVASAVMGHLRDAGRTVVVVSHSIQDLERVADRVVMIDGGRVRLDGDLEELAISSVRLAVTLRDDNAVWSPPGDPVVERAGRDVTLTYLDFHARYQSALQADAAIADVHHLGRDLEDVFRAAVSADREEESPCVVS